MPITKAERHRLRVEARKAARGETRARDFVKERERARELRALRTLGLVLPNHRASQAQAPAPPPNYVLIVSPPSEEIVRGSRSECEYVRDVLLDLNQLPNIARSYIVMTARQWEN